jgi:hypothetical protein
MGFFGRDCLPLRFSGILNALTSSAVGRTRTEASMGFTAVFLDIFVPAILISEASEKVLTAHAPGNVGDAVFAANIRA